MKKRWTPEEDEILQQLWPDTVDIGRTLGRTLDSIRWRARTQFGLLPPHTASIVADSMPSEPSTVEEFAEEIADVMGRVQAKTPDPRTYPHDTAEHEACLILSDSHVGQVVHQGIGAYDTNLFLERANRLERAVLSYANLYQQSLPVKVLNVFALGDDLEGHGQIFPAQALFMDRNLRDQWVTFAERMTLMLKSFLEKYEQVNVWKVVGNHGRVGRAGEHHPQDNVEAFLWMLIQERFRDEPRMRIEIADDFFMLVERMGKLFLLRHGEGTMPHSPYSAKGGFNVKLRANSLVGRIIDYMLVAHHHTPVIIDRELVGEIIYNGCWVGPNDLSVKWLNEGNLPSQWHFLLHPTYGVIHTSKIKLALPEELRSFEVLS